MFELENKIFYMIIYKAQKCMFYPDEQKDYSYLPNNIKGHVLYPEEGTYNIEGWFHPITILKNEILQK